MRVRRRGCAGELGVARELAAAPRTRSLSRGLASGLGAIAALAACLAAVGAFAGCAQAPAAPDTAVSHEVPPDAVPPSPPQPTLVVPRPGMADARPYGFEAATPRGDDRTLRVTFWGGVAPCFVLDRAEVREAPDAVTVTLFAGSDPAQRDAACIEIALYMAVDVPLASPLGGRPVLDGAAGAGTSTQGSKSGVD